jgi:acetylornithine/succinyldiaminopimelate/putrescine aminotransferase
LKKLAAEFPAHVRDVRGRGFQIGLEMTGETGPWIEALAQGGLLAAPAGGNVVRLLPPLNVTSADLSKSVEIFRAVLSAKA